MATPIDRMIDQACAVVRKDQIEHDHAMILLDLADAAVAWEKQPSQETQDRLYEATRAWEDIGG